MFGVNEFIRCFRLNISLTENQKKEILKSGLKDKSVMNYLEDKLSKLSIKLNNEDEYPVFELMKKNKLLTTCFQTSETIAALLNDDDYVERGNMIRGGMLDSFTYNHSWVCFKYNGVEYVLDACLNILCTKNDYYYAFKPLCYARVKAESIKEELIRQLVEVKDDTRSYNEDGLSYDVGLWDDGSTCLVIKKKGEVDIVGSEDRNSPLYGNHSSYIADIKNRDIKKLVFHHYKRPWCD